MSMLALSVIIPASNEAHRIGGCLASLAAQAEVSGASLDVIVVANGCRDETVAVAHDAGEPLARRGAVFRVLELAGAGKIDALNAGDAAALAPARLYLDADNVLSNFLVARLLEVLDSPLPVYAGARLVVSPPHSGVSRLYARFWQRLPFLTEGVSGAGLYAVNRAGRGRWDAFPQVIADDAFVRSLFAPGERRQVDATYLTPLSEGFAELVRVRRRQDAGVHELARLGRLREGADAPRSGNLLRLMAQDPLGFGVYAAVRAATHLGRAHSSWDRGTR